MNIQFVVIGLGSMGKRRIRCLQALGEKQIVGIDPREDRRHEVMQAYGVETLADLASLPISTEKQAWIISVPPAAHHFYMKEAVKQSRPFFVEASVVDTGMVELIEGTRALVAAPSATLLFHPAIQQIRALVQSGQLGKISNVVMHSGQYLPDWHTYEQVQDYYVSQRDTGGAREIVPFELTWLTRVFGWPMGVSAQVRKTIDIVGAEAIDDTYNLLLDFSSYSMILTVDVVSRVATRRLLINGEQGQLVWDWNHGVIRLFDASKQAWEEMPYERGQSAEGYNANISEQMYIDEVAAFCQAITADKLFPNTLAEDHRILKILYAAEEASRCGVTQRLAV